jgi:hypothetical protein
MDKLGDRLTEKQSLSGARVGGDDAADRTVDNLLAMYDTDHNGQFSEQEVRRIIQDLKHQSALRKAWKQSTFLILAVLVVGLVALFGVSLAAAEYAKELKSDSTDDDNGPTLYAKSTGELLSAGTAVGELDVCSVLDSSSMWADLKNLGPIYTTKAALEATVASFEDEELSAAMADEAATAYSTVTDVPSFGYYGQYQSGLMDVTYSVLTFGDGSRLYFQFSSGYVFLAKWGAPALHLTDLKCPIHSPAEEAAAARLLAADGMYPVSSRRKRRQLKVSGRASSATYSKTSNSRRTDRVRPAAASKNRAIGCVKSGAGNNWMCKNCNQRTGGGWTCTGLSTSKRLTCFRTSSGSIQDVVTDQSMYDWDCSRAPPLVHGSWCALFLACMATVATFAVA